ncbi:hypothetical protein LCGC14_1675080, partial [marine sediment metagenome]
LSLDSEFGMMQYVLIVHGRKEEHANQDSNTLLILFHEKDRDRNLGSQTLLQRPNI